MAELPRGFYDQLVTKSLLEAVGRLPGHLKAEIAELGDEDAIEYLVREIAERFRRWLRDELGSSEGEGDPTRIRAEWLARANLLLNLNRHTDPAEAKLLTAVRDAVVTDTHKPLLPLAQSALVTNESGLNYHSFLRSELLSCDRVDIICPFIGTAGVNLILDALKQVRGGIRLITTTYLGASHAKALVQLAGIGAEIKIAYESADQKTSLHAKAWIFHRDSGFSTATIGSSNLSSKALVDGLEWNLRVGARDQSEVLSELSVTFERLWQDRRFERFDAERDAQRLSRALDLQAGGTNELPSFLADLNPYPHQQEALEALAYARLDGRHRNLVVAATGTGKTLMAAFDFRRLTQELRRIPTFLFVAHREAILNQSLGAFRAALRDTGFGEMNVGPARATEWKHVFASVQSLSRMDLGRVSRDHFEVMVIDEFHHAEARTYRRLLEHFQPRELLALTATPERADGQQSVIADLMPPTYELRLWHALERNLLCPFHYFGIDDGTDLSSVRWVAGRYDDDELETQFIRQGEERMRLVASELDAKCERKGLRAVAFCATIRHCDFVAEQLRSYGYVAEPLHSRLSEDKRREVDREFRSGGIEVVCTVDLFNEGVDIPEINTVLFLRPTESATVYIQQLGRGLRNHYDKGALTVLDFVGRQNHRFRMDLRFRAMTGLSRKQLESAIKLGFPALPPGCDIRLDRVTQQRVLENIKSAVPSNIGALVAEYRRLSVDGRAPSVGEFLSEVGLEPTEFYASRRSLQLVRLRATLPGQNPEPKHERVGAVAHVDDRARAQAYLASIREGTRSDHYRMLAAAVCERSEVEIAEPQLAGEIAQLMEHLACGSPVLPAVADDLPFRLHARYTRNEIVAPFRNNPDTMRQGTFYVPDRGLDVHLVTLAKSDRLFSPTTRYRDYFEAPDRLHWESQSTTSATSPTGRRLIGSEGRHLFFVRVNKDEPFVCLGFARSFWYQSERPIQIRWQLDHPVPDHLYVLFERASG